MYLVVYDVISDNYGGLKGKQSCTEVPDRMSARDKLGMSTISSTGFSLGKVCRDRILYDSSYNCYQRVRTRCR